MTAHKTPKTHTSNYQNATMNYQKVTISSQTVTIYYYILTLSRTLKELPSGGIFRKEGFFQWVYFPDY